ncbi:unnamed protein product [Clonostachys solani]|uniref:Protein kinase domain-containing protein n=1 Tax=Clonostachys solani TaxID=160281 RepID=A0A9P0EGM3_9HYPO|nr:unnamed protein product [Clonostachys solani]
MAGNTHSGLPANLYDRIRDGLESRAKTGINGSQEAKKYLLYEDLTQFWEPPRIREVLIKVGLSGQVLESTIKTKYLRVFSTLAFANKVQYLSYFTRYSLSDEHWPNRHSDQAWSDAMCDGFLKEFTHNKWMFFPFEFDRDDLVHQELPDQRILPIEEKEENSPRDEYPNSPLLTKVTINKSCNKLGSNSAINTFMIKSYKLDDPSQQAAYDHEAEAYTLLESMGHSDHVVRFYGGFRQSRAGHLVLEFVKGETLKQYLARNQQPQTISDIYHFWQSYLGIITGLFKIHQMNGDPQRPTKAVIHQDLKFDNILVTEIPDSVSRYSFVAKLIDFEHSSIVDLVGGGDEPASPDRQGHPSFSPPEASHHMAALNEGPHVVTRFSDIWSLGCITSLLVAWVAEGPENMETAGQLRSEELNGNHSFSSYHTRCFHDGNNLIESVRDSHRLFRQQLNGYDMITPAILTIVEEQMLRPNPNDRSGAKQLHSAIERAIDKHKKYASEGDSATERHYHPIQATERTLGGPPDQYLTIDQVLEYRRAKKSKGNEAINPIVDNRVQTLVKNLKSRDHLFFIDNSPSMEAHEGEVVRVFTALSYIAKKIDSNAIELAFASSPDLVFAKKNTSDLIDILRKATYDQNPEMMENKLQMFIDRAVIPKLPVPRSLNLFLRSKPISVIILTNGCWGTGLEKGTGVERTIRNLVSIMEKKGVDRTKVMIQFLQFGTDEDGSKYLKYLDDIGQDDGFDIVDSSVVKDDVSAIFVGSIGPYTDARNSSQSARSS